jgi:hypothetical protein
MQTMDAASFTCAAGTLGPSTSNSFLVSCGYSGTTSTQGTISASLVTPTSPADSVSANNAMASPDDLRRKLDVRVDSIRPTCGALMAPHFFVSGFGGRSLDKVRLELEKGLPAIRWVMTRTHTISGRLFADANAWLNRTSVRHS